MTQKEILDSLNSSTAAIKSFSVDQSTERQAYPKIIDPIMEEMGEIKRMLRELLSQKATVEEKSDIMDLKEASKFLCMSLSSIYKKTSKNSIPLIKRPGSSKLLFSRASLTKWLEESEEPKTNKVDEHLRRNLRVRKVQNN
jgi:predicted DNA-binding transcriptional regulator AlpA